VELGDHLAKIDSLIPLVARPIADKLKTMRKMAVESSAIPSGHKEIIDYCFDIKTQMFDVEKKLKRFKL
jgi:hypothetical protein